MLFQLVTDDQT